MGHIRRLPDDLANQIAAGEVVERPASVVKELVENALDAGATRVKVELEQGGLALLRVSDDGAGMDADDAVLSLERHATSKIRMEADLLSLHTFGFRGEALPSIASVSKLRVVTRERGAQEATEVVVDGGGVVRACPAGSFEGTSVEVRDLFFNVPARRKFLKSTATESAHVSEAMQVLALSRPDASFFLVRDGRAVREWLRVATRAERAQQAFPGEHLKACFGERGPLRIEAHLGPPERARAGALALHLLVNGRPARDRALARAVAHAYGSVLEPGKYPVGAAYVDLPLHLVDVNVHPQKAEVRFADGRALFEAVTRELHTALAQAFSVPALGSTRGWSTMRSSKGSDQAGAPPAAPYRPDGAGPGVASPMSIADPWNASLSERTHVTSSDADLFEGTRFYGSLELLGQARSTFLVCRGNDGLYVLDQHAAAERVTFHRLRRAYVARAVATQRLLIPEVVELQPSDVAILDEHGAAIAALGVELRATGPSAVAVHAVPALLARPRPERIARDLVAEFGGALMRPFGEAVDRVLATMACHGSVRAGDALSREEASALLRALDEVDFAGHCPHGRPVVTRIGYDELERRVGR